MKTIYFYLAVLLAGCLCIQNSWAQLLKPGFEKAEYLETLKINQRAHIPVDKWSDTSAIPPPSDYNFVYRSPVVAFDNIWDLWVNKNLLKNLRMFVCFPVLRSPQSLYFYLPTGPIY